MYEASNPDVSAADVSAAEGGMSRRNLFVGLGAAAGVGATLAALPGFAGAAAPTFGPEAAGLGASIPGLTYLNYDAQAFFATNQGESPAQSRHFEEILGSAPATFNTRIWAPLLIPVGSVVFQMSASYQNQPIMEISRRPLFNNGGVGTAPVQEFQKSFADSPGGAFASTELLPVPVTIQADSTYTISCFCTSGTSLYGVSVGYRPPTQGFIPFTGANPRVLDTRNPGQTKFEVDEQRKINLGMPGARSGVFNLTVVDTEGNNAGRPPGGFVSAFAGDTYPGNSTVNWDHPGQISANLAIAALDVAGNVTLRAGVNRTDVVVDVIGYMI
jgi:hypothetical protein